MKNENLNIDKEKLIKLKEDYISLKEELTNKIREKSMSSLTLFLIGALIGVSGTSITVVSLNKKKQNNDSTQQIISEIGNLKDAVSKGQIDVQKNLTDLDLVRESCSEVFISKHGDGLCRELFCRMQQRGIDSKTSGSECESISNINNTITIIEQCEKIKSEDKDEKSDCEELFFKIK